MLTKEYQFKESVPTQENFPTMNNQADVSAADLLKEEDDEDAKFILPIAKIFDLGKTHIRDMRWFMNDLFIMVTTVNNEVLVLDSLLYTYFIDKPRHIGPNK